MLALLLCLGGLTTVRAEPERCQLPVATEWPEADAGNEMTVTADNAEITPEGVSIFTGGVRVSRGAQQIETGELRYDPATRQVTVQGGATYREPGLEISAADASYDSGSGEASFYDGRIEVPSRPARGEATRVRANGSGRLALDEVLYTTCMEDNPDWELRANEIQLDVRESKGTARKVVLNFKDVPIAYLPYISFPLDDSRKSGLLFPEIGTSDRSGTEITIPFYWNIAPNYDAIIAPRYLADRGIQWNTQFRYLIPSSHGELNVEYLPDDDKFEDDRRLTHWQHLTNLTTNLRMSADIKEASDRNYFEDLGSGVDVTSQTHLLRNVELAYLTDNWNFVARGRNYQTIDSGITDEDKPYEQLPQLIASGTWGRGPLGLTYGWQSEFVSFTHEENVEGMRLIVQPDVSLPIEGPGYFLVPRAAWRHTRYDLDNQEPGKDDDPSLTAPIYSLDAGLLFERDTGSGKFLQTLEPRVLYAHIPFEDQDSMPIFDTGEPDTNMVQLFRANRFVGGDRLGDTDQVSVGVTTRVINAVTGREFLTATLGQAYYLSDRDVTLPDETVDDDDQSNLVAEIGLDIFRDWNADFGYQWDPDDTSTSLAEARVQYRPASNKVANLTYRYRPAILEQAEVSLGWPVTDRWSFVGLIEYSMRDNRTIERLLGIQYESCCWAGRLASRRQISNRDGSSDTTVLFQIEFKGLAGVGSDVRKRFEGDILGYSVYE